MQNPKFANLARAFIGIDQTKGTTKPFSQLDFGLNTGPLTKEQETFLKAEEYGLDLDALRGTPLENLQAPTSRSQALLNNITALRNLGPFFKFIGGNVKNVFPTLKNIIKEEF